MTNWDPAQTQKVLTAAIAKNDQIDVIVSDFGPSLVGALPEFEQSGRSIPALATSDGNVLACFYEDNKADNPDFKLFTVATGNDNVRLAIQHAVARATGGEQPDSTTSSRRRSSRTPVTGDNPVAVRERPARRHLPLRRDARRGPGRSSLEVADHPDAASGRSERCRPARPPRSAERHRVREKDHVNDRDRPTAPTVAAHHGDARHLQVLRRRRRADRRVAGGAARRGARAARRERRRQVHAR